jgi:predicted MPP superfamily phosphohydrolase
MTLSVKWLNKRKELEASSLIYSVLHPAGTKSKDSNILKGIKIVESMLKILGVYNFLNKKALEIGKESIAHRFKNLPRAFHQFKIAHLSDLHLDERPDVFESIKKHLLNEELDLVVFTGDFVSFYGPHKNDINLLVEPICNLLSCLKPKFGWYAVLGNHDSSQVAEVLDNLGIKILTNSSEDITINDEKIRLIGTDDVFYFYTDDAIKCLKNAREVFCIGLVHSPDLYDFAENEGVDLYLCGHTHAGQLALPGGWAPLTQTLRGKYYRNTWKWKSMVGYTSPGVGTCGSAIRFNTTGKVVIHELIRVD